MEAAASMAAVVVTAAVVAGNSVHGLQTQLMIGRNELCKRTT